jgi:hypothetical protein
VRQVTLYRDTCIDLTVFDPASPEFKRSNESGGEKFGHYVLAAIASLLLIRQVFAVVAVIMGNTEQFNQPEDLWYGLIAVPEIISVVLFATPDLVPPRLVPELPQ